VKRIAFSALALSALVDCAWADGGAAALTPAFGLLQTVLGLAFVIALIFATGWVMRRIAPHGVTRGPIRIIASAAIGPRERVVLVRCQNEILTLGVAPGHVSLLQTRPVTDDVQSVPGMPAPIPFGERLRALLKRPAAN
jgi:flagellar protein FliO/FliZ